MTILILPLVIYIGYKNYNINRVKATRMLNSNASLRGAINELLITNYKNKKSEEVIKKIF